MNTRPPGPARRPPRTVTVMGSHNDGAASGRQGRTPSEATIYWRLPDPPEAAAHPAAAAASSATADPADPEPATVIRAALTRHGQNFPGADMLDLGAGQFRVIDHDARRVVR